MLSTVQHIKQSVFKLRRCTILSISPQSVNIWELWRPAAGVLEMNVGPFLFDRGFLLLNSPVSSLSYYFIMMLRIWSLLLPSRATIAAAGTFV